MAWMRKTLIFKFHCHAREAPAHVQLGACRAVERLASGAGLDLRDATWVKENDIVGALRPLLSSEDQGLADGAQAAMVRFASADDLPYLKASME